MIKMNKVKETVETIFTQIEQREKLLDKIYDFLIDNQDKFKDTKELNKIINELENIEQYIFGEED